MTQHLVDITGIMLYQSLYEENTFPEDRGYFNRNKRWFQKFRERYNLNENYEPLELGENSKDVKRVDTLRIGREELAQAAELKQEKEKAEQELKARKHQKESLEQALQANQRVQDFAVLLPNRTLEDARKFDEFKQYLLGFSILEKLEINHSEIVLNP